MKIKKWKSKLWLGTVVFLMSAGLALPLNLNAEEPITEPEKKEEVERALILDEMVVTVTKMPVKVREQPAAISVVTAEDIRLRARADTFYDAVRNVPGVYVAGVGGMAGPVMKIRGKRPVVLVNGRDMTPFMSNFIFNSRNIGMGAIDRIEVLKGPQAAIHGSKAISGVVNVILKRGDKDNPYMETRFFLGEGGEISSGLSLSGGYGKFSYFLDISGAAQDEFKTPRGIIPFVDYRQQNIYARFDYALSDDHEITFEFTHNDSQTTSGGVGFYYEPSPRNAIWKSDPSFEGSYLSYRGDITDWFSLNAYFGIARNEVNFVFARPNWEPERFLNRESTTSFQEDIMKGDIRGTFKLLPNDRLRLIAGLQHRTIELDGFAERTRGGVKAPFYDWDKEEKYWAPYVQVEFRPITHALIVAGVRHDSFDTVGKKESRTSPNVGLSLFPFAHTDYNWTTIWTSYSEAFRTPTAAQRYLPAFLGGNPDLKSELAKGWEIGLKQRIGLWANLELSYFETDYENLIELRRMPAPAVHPWRIINIGEAKYEGYELLLELYPTDRLTLHFGYADLNRTNEITGKRMYGGMAGQTFQYGLTLTDLYGFSFSAWGEQHSDYKINETTDHPSEGDVIWNAKLLYTWNITQRAVFEPFASFENLTDEEYFSSQPGLGIQEGRAWHVGASLNIGF